MNAVELEDLRKRVAAGNDKLNIALLKIHEENDPNEHKNQMSKWYEAKEKLIKLTNELNKAGYFGCMYTTKQCFDSDGNIHCLVCPDLFWINPNEKVKNTAPKIISDQAIEQVKQVRDNPELKKFLETLGGLI